MPDAPAATPLAGVFPPRLVARLHRERFEGTLRLHGGGATRVIYFRRGEIASAASNADEDRLPSILIREGRLTGPQVEMARTKQRPGVSLGKTLIELGFLTPGELLQGARRQVKQILAAAFALRDGTSQEVPGPLPPEVTVLGLPVRRLIFDALLDAGDRQDVVQEMGSMETVYRPSIDLDTALPALRLEPPHEEVARLVDGRATLREISGRVRLDDLTVSKIVLALEILGLVEQESLPAAAAPTGRRIPVISDESQDAPEHAVTWGVAEPVAPAVPPPIAPAPAVPSSMAPAPAAIPAPPPAAVAAPASTPVSGSGWAAAAPTVPFEPAPAEEPEPADTPAFASAYAAAPPDEPVAAPPSGWPAPAIEFEEEEDTPPIPPGELPAFAAPPNAPTGWSVDPETGEKVHLGPVELIFDGRVVPPHPGGAGRGRLALFGAAGLLAAAAIVACFVVMRSGEADETTPAEIASSHVAETATPPAEPEPDPAAAPPAGTAPETSGAGTNEDLPPGREPAAQDMPSPAKAGEAAPSPAAPPREDAPVPPEQATHAGTGAATAADGFGFGQRLLDAGTVDRAAETFRRALEPIPAGRFTLQVMIACEAESVRKARAGTRPDAGLFVLPITVRGRGCFRVLWGVFESRDAAAAGARADLPQYFVTSGVSPAVVAIDRLRSPS
jgi:hypothetical protein